MAVLANGFGSTGDFLLGAIDAIHTRLSVLAIDHVPHVLPRTRLDNVNSPPRSARSLYLKGEKTRHLETMISKVQGERVSGVRHLSSPFLILRTAI